VCDRMPFEVRIVAAGRHRGFARAVNVGLAAARGRYIVVLNNDVSVAPGFIDALVATAEATGASLVVPRVLSMTRPDRIDNTGNELYGDGLNLCRARGQPDEPANRVPIDPLLPSGAAVLIRRSLLSRIGGFDPAYFAYGEDAELGMRALRAGFECRYAPDAVVYHLGSGTWGPASLRKAYLVERNRARLAAAHLPLRRWVMSPLHTALRYIQHAVDGARGRGPMSTYPGVSRSGAAAAATAALLASAVAAPLDRSRHGAKRALDGRSPQEFDARVASRLLGLDGLRARRDW